MDALLLRDNSGIQVSREIRERFPAVFNSTPSHRTSEKYELYPSHEVIDAMADKGMKLVELAQQRSSKRSPLHTQHVMRFAPQRAPKAFGISDSIPEVVVMNSHDGKGRFRAYAGIFRFVCDNGMVVADELLGSTVRRHFGKVNTFDKVMGVLAKLPKTVIQVSDTIQDWNGLKLTQAEQAALAAAMLKARRAPEWVSPELALKAQREADEANKDGSRSLWHTFNVLQENLTRKQLQRPEGLTEGRQSPMRPISGAVQGVEFNRLIWTQAQAYFQASQEAPQDQRLVEFFHLQAKDMRPDQARTLAQSLRGFAEGDARKALAREVELYRKKASRAKAKRLVEA